MKVLIFVALGLFGALVMGDPHFPIWGGAPAYTVRVWREKERKRKRKRKRKTEEREGRILTFSHNHFLSFFSFFFSFFLSFFLSLSFFRFM